ncbi:Copia protein, partial [Mucuna pruriens]
MAHGICEGLWMKIILDDLKVKYEGPIKLFCDNNSAMSIGHNPVQHDRTKHIEIDRNFIKEKLDSGLIVTAHVPTGLQVVDVFTKGLPATRFQALNVMKSYSVKTSVIVPYGFIYALSWDALIGCDIE